jgi:quercetin dioxygenase-like cupin family protein
MTSAQLLPPADALALQSLISPTEGGISSRILAKTSGGNFTLFAFDAGQGLTEHTSPFDAYVLVLEGALLLRIGGQPVRATPGTIVRMPAGVQHGLEAPDAAGKPRGLTRAIIRPASSRPGSADLGYPRLLG